MIPRFVSSREAIDSIKDNDVVVTSGFVGCSNPEGLEVALEEKFLETKSPKNLTLFYVAGQGDGDSKAVGHLAHEGLLGKIVAGHFNKAPKIVDLIINNKIQAYNVPQGALCHMLRDVAGKKIGTFTHVGLNTFADPRLEGGKLNDITTEDIVELMTIHGQERLFYKPINFNVALIKGSLSDERGNISLERESITTECISIAQAVHNCGGTVIVQVDKIVETGSLDPKLVKIPGIYVDYVVEIDDPLLKEEVYGQGYVPELCGAIRVSNKSYSKPTKLDAKKLVARRATMEIEKGMVGNLGVGNPEYVSVIATEENIGDYMVLTVESGPVGGIPQGGPRFGSAVNADAIIDQTYQFDFYEGGGLDIAFLGLAQVDEEGNLNVSKFGKKVAGCGGFVSISQNSKKVVYCGTFTAGGLELEIKDGKLKILKEGKSKKFVKKVQQITFSGNYARNVGQPVLYVTERAVFSLKKEGLTLIEIAPGIDLQKDILDLMDFKPIIAKDLKEMDNRIFREGIMGIKNDK
ncbi:MAG: malonate decarboxylase subunit alpha [Fusobacteriaceae bacterium]|jgi:propionate CoA-transferase|nr:malonate decarboxylase subunit alpha [Fusobacteriaceae bacterium]